MGYIDYMTKLRMEAEQELGYFKAKVAQHRERVGWYEKKCKELEERIALLVDAGANPEDEEEA